MTTRKSEPRAPFPELQDGWVRKSELDLHLDRLLPIPTQVVSNEEFVPMPQTPEQRAVEQILNSTTHHITRRLGISRRSFLRSACGMAAAFAAMNSVFGPFFTVHAEEILEPAAATEKRIPYFVFDVQTHHVATGKQHPVPLQLRKFGAELNAALANREPEMKDLWLENYIKEVFLDSETDVAVLTGIVDENPDMMILPPEEIVRTRQVVNDLTRSRRLVSHGIFAPNLPHNDEWMARQSERLKIEAWKGYTGNGWGTRMEGWRVDDEKVAYPALQGAMKSGVKAICLHKGLPLGERNFEYWNPSDIPKAATDFPGLNFLVYHAGFQSVQRSMDEMKKHPKQRPYIAWTSDLCRWRKKNPAAKNVFMELGSTFGMCVVSSPELTAHLLGQIIEAFGEDHVLWGTDSIWWGSPQWQIDAFRRFQIPEKMVKQFGYKPLTPEVKRKIFGLNASKIYGVDPSAKRQPVPGDYVDRLKKIYEQNGVLLPSNTQYGWVAPVQG